MQLSHSHSSAFKTFNNRGFTLVELMITVAIAGIVTVAISSVYTSMRRTSTAQEQVAEMQQSIRAGLDIMNAETRMAGNDPRGAADTGFPAIPTAGIPSSSATNLTFTMVADTDGIDNDGDLTTDEQDETETVNYYLFDANGDGDLDLVRRTPVTIQAVAENIDALEFFYTLADGSQTTNPTAVQLANIRAVQISILARPDRPDIAFVNTDTYTPASGAPPVWDINGGAAGTGNPPGDSFRRRLLITTIQCRNMGL